MKAILHVLPVLLISFPFFSPAQEEAKPDPYPCLKNEEARRFDFWIGTWDVYQGDKKVGESRITMAKGGCAIHESYATAGAYAGQSMNYYDPIDACWKQNWVGSSGDVTTYEELKGEGDMGFIARHMNRQGKIIQRRMVFFYQKEADAVRQLIEDFDEKSASWKVVFDGKYVRVE